MRFNQFAGSPRHSNGLLDRGGIGLGAVGGQAEPEWQSAGSS